MKKLILFLFLVIVAGVVALTGCGSAKEIDANTRQYVAQTKADTGAQAAQVEINATATAVQRQANVDAGAEQEKIAAEIDFVWWRSVTVNTVMVVVGLVAIVWLYYSTRFVGAKTREAEAKAVEAQNRAAKYVAFPLDAQTGAYPAIGMGNMLLLPNQLATLDAETAKDGNETAITSAAQVQASRLVAYQAAKAAKNGDGSGVAGTTPTIFDYRNGK